jgi:uncharacterized protein YegJ (DUF2314 family)
MKGRAFVPGVMLSLAMAMMLPAPSFAREITQRVARSDPRMQAAEKQARETLPIFWRRLGSRDPQIDVALVSVGFPTPEGNIELLWMTLTKIDGSKISGRIVNESTELPNIHVQQEVVVDESTIADWSYRKAGKFYGQFTTRVMLKRVDAKTAAAEGAVLAPTPLEPGDH